MGAPRGLQPPRGGRTRQSVVRLRWFVRLKAFSSALRLSFFATFSRKVPEVGKCRAGHLKTKVSPKKLFPKLALQRRPEYPGRERCKLLPGPGEGGPERVRPGAGPGRRARLFRARGVPAARSAGRGRQVDAARFRLSFCQSARSSGRPLRAASCGCSGFLFATRLEGGLPPHLFARVCYVCVCAKYLYLGNERWALAAGGEPLERQRGRLRARGEADGLHPAAGGEVATLSAVPAFIKEKGECERWVETAFPLLAESQRREGGELREGLGRGRSA